ncbi:MAG: acyltransferase, partial [Acidobacteria bacterium]|nr:acyltransferase [Acidobacteriota bacterium]
CMMASSRGMIAKQQPTLRFLRRRLRRIFPPFWFSIFVAMATPFVIAVLYGWRSGVYQWPAPKWAEFTLLDWTALATLTKGLLWMGPTHKPYAAVSAVYWSLSIEVQFYLVMTLALAFRRWFHAILIGVSAVCCGIWLYHGPFYPGLFGEYWPMFALGLLLFALLDAGVRPCRLFGRRTAWLSAITGLACLVGALGLVMFVPDEGIQRQTLFGMFSAAILWLASGVEPSIPRQALVSRALVGLGKISYSVYLLHLHLVSLGAAVVVSLYPHKTVFSLPLRMGIALVFCWVFYEICEKRFAVNGPRAARPKPAPALLTVKHREEVSVG